MSWMTSTAPAGADGFNQAFGFNALTGDHGSKQGWSDPGWSPANLHSVGWTERYFAAVLQTSPTASYATMRATSTHTAQLIATVLEPQAGDLGKTAVDAGGARTPLTDWTGANGSIDIAAFGHSLAKALRTNEVVAMVGVGRLAAEILRDGDRRC